MIVPKINVDDIIKYAKAGGYDGRYLSSKGDIYNLTDLEHCYTMFLYELDMQLVGNDGNRDFPIKEAIEGKSYEYACAYIQGRIDELIRGYAIRYSIDSLKRNDSVELLKEDFSAKSIYILQYLLKINGFKIDTPLSTKDFCDQMSGISYGEKRIPVVFTGEFADQEKMKLSLVENNVKGAASIKNHLPEDPNAKYNKYL